MTLYADSGSAARPFAEAIAWLWRLELSDSPGQPAVGIGAISEAEGMSDLVESGALAGAIVLCDGHGSEAGWVPAHESVDGIAEIDEVGRLRGRFTVFPGSEPDLDSSLGPVAVRRGVLLAVGAPADGGWGSLSVAAALTAVAGFLDEIGTDPRSVLPPVGVIRLDDFPGTAQHQLEDRARPDRRQARRMGRLWREFARSEGVLNVAVAARGLRGAEVVPLEEVWPKALRELREGIAAGAIEPVSHGLLHLDPHAFERGEVEFREFSGLDARESRDRIEAARRWMEEAIGRPATFVAPAWAYGDFAQAAAAELGLPSWFPPLPGPLAGEMELRETLDDGPPGLVGLDYRPLGALARLGLPPTVVTHGALLDDRMSELGLPRDAATLARLLVRRDLSRLASVPGVRWVGAGRYGELLRAHANDVPAAP